MIPDSFIQDLKASCDIEDIVSGYVKLTRKGKNLVGLCPFHSEKTGSFFIYPQTQSFYCFGCGAGGDTISFLKRIENLDYVEAVRLLAQKAGVPVPEDSMDDSGARLKARTLEINRETARFYHQCLVSDVGKDAYRYLIERGRTPKIIRRFGLGYAPDDWNSLVDHLKSKGFREEEMVASGICGRTKKGGLYDRFRGRVIFPIIDLRGNVVAFGGRAMGERGPKYLNSSDTPVFKKSKNLFALNFAKASKAPNLILAEGYMDVIAIHQAGFDNAVATLGTSLTEEQARIIAQYTDTIIIAYDSDNAGQAATKRAINIFSEVGVKVNVLTIPDAKDPDEYLKKFGPERFQMLLEGCTNALEFEIAKIRNKYDVSTADGKVSFLKDFARLLADIRNPLEREVYLTKTAEELGVAPAAITAQINSIQKGRKNAQAKKEKNDTSIYIGDIASGRKDMDRKRNLKYAVAEEHIIEILMKNPDYVPHFIKQCAPSEFVTEVNREIVTLLCDRIQTHRSVEPMALSADLSEEAMDRLSGILASETIQRADRTQLDEYIRILKEHGQQRSEQEIRDMDPDEYLRYVESLKARKS